MTDKEIIRACEVCTFAHGKTCKPCPYFVTATRTNCLQMRRDTLDLINRQQAEIERLQKAEEEYPFKVKVEHNSEVHSKSIEDYDNFLDGVSSEAIKAFAERLCENRVSNDPVVIAVKVELEEMAGKNL